MNKIEPNNQLNTNHNLQLFEQVTAIMRMNGLTVDQKVQKLLQPYIDGSESSEQAIVRLEDMLAEVE